jgi:hypothetical protein
MTLPVKPESVDQNDEPATARFVPKMGSNILLWLIFGFFVVFLIWASLTEIDRTVRGMGRVVPSSKMQVISNLEGGIVQEVLVRTGQEVKSGEPLVRLDPTATGGEFGSGSATVAALAAKIERLKAEITGRSPNLGGLAALPKSNGHCIAHAWRNLQACKVRSSKSGGGFAVGKRGPIHLRSTPFCSICGASRT